MNLDNLKKAIAENPRNETARSILEYLERGDAQSAKNLYSWDGDKIASNHELQGAVESLLGCRTHHEKNCQNWLCVKIRRLREEFPKKLH